MHQNQVKPKHIEIKPDMRVLLEIEQLNETQGRVSLGSYVEEVLPNKCFLIQMPVNSGGADAASARSYFTDLFEKEPKHKIVSLTIPEKVLFLPKASFYVVHEIFHYFMDILLRNVRHRFLIKTLGAHYANIIAENLFDDILNPRCREYMKSHPNSHINEEKFDVYSSQLSRSMTIVVIKHLNKQLGKEKVLFASDADEILYSKIQSLLNPLNMDSYYAITHSKVNYTAIKDNPLLNDILCVFELYWSLLKTNNVPLTFKEMDEKISNMLSPRTDAEGKQYRRFVHASNEKANGIPFADSCRNYMHIFLNTYTGRQKSNIPIIYGPAKILYEVTKELFQECYCDVCACITLKYELKDYLHAMASDEDTFKSLIPPDAINYGRFFSVINVCFFADFIDSLNPWELSNMSSDAVVIKLRDYSLRMFAEAFSGNISLPAEKFNHVKNLTVQYITHMTNYHLYSDVVRFLRICISYTRQNFNNAPFSSELHGFANLLNPHNTCDTQINTLYEILQTCSQKTV
ncbi:MAG: hypothetical protein FWC16_13835 [Defluviitaleaceae bacterium]|nr:hypothetical protein [Defluviitaleaceae bacterium]MCL2275994.1 hypothetical protein [Defluviitaleaceae bacterium]